MNYLYWRKFAEARATSNERWWPTYAVWTRKKTEAHSNPECQDTSVPSSRYRQILLCPVFPYRGEPFWPPSSSSGQTRAPTHVRNASHRIPFRHRQPAVDRTCPQQWGGKHATQQPGRKARGQATSTRRRAACHTAARKLRWLDRSVRRTVVSSNAQRRRRARHPVFLVGPRARARDRRRL